MTYDIEAGLWYVDVRYQGTERLIACGVMETPAGLLLVDPGPERSLANVLEALNERGFMLSDVAAILLTHIHLDHAGATGTLVERNRRIRVFVHQQGARHMVNPSRLLKSARRIYGDQMNDLWGEFVAVPDENVEPLSGGETIGPGGRMIDVRYTPGHAIHHVTYFDRATSTAFVGDTTGMSVHGIDHVVPVTPPPDIDLNVWDESLARVRDLNPIRLFLTHFGPVGHPQGHLVAFARTLQQWAEEVRTRVHQNPDQRAAAASFRQEKVQEMRRAMPEDAVALYERFADPAGSFMGLARYWDRQQND